MNNRNFMVLITSSIAFSSHVFAEDANSKVPSRNFYCSVGKSTEKSSSLINYKKLEVVVEGKIHARQAYNMQYIPAWEKEVAYEAGNGYSIQVAFSAMKYQPMGDFLKDQPIFRMTASLLKDGQIISKASTQSDIVAKGYIHNTTSLIELDLSLFNLLPNAAADGISEANISCKMPIDWEFSSREI